MNTKIEKQSVVSFKNVSFAYKKEHGKVLKNISFDLPVGCSLTIFGTNGSGKSTLGKLIAGLISRFSGKITILGQTLTVENCENIIRNVGIVFQNAESQFIGEDVENDLAFGLENLNTPPNQMLIQITNIARKLSISNILHYEPVNLSGGQKQRVAIASTLVTEPKIIIFDESTSMLGSQDEKQILQIIDQLRKDKKITVIEITHNMERILTSDLVLFLEEGKIVFFGKSQDLLARYEELSSYFSGFDLPFIYQLSQALKKNKIVDQVFLNQKQLATHLWKLKK